MSYGHARIFDGDTGLELMLVRAKSGMKNQKPAFAIRRERGLFSFFIKLFLVARIQEVFAEESLAMFLALAVLSAGLLVRFAQEHEYLWDSGNELLLRNIFESCPKAFAARVIGFQCASRI